MQYHDLDIWLNSHNPDLGGYPLKASCERQGEFPDLCSIDPDAGTIQEMRSRVVREDTNRALLTDLGTALYSALFTAKEQKIGKLLERCRGLFLSKGGEGIRIRLRIEPPKLAALPWELLYDHLEKCFLAVSTRTPVVRYIELPQLTNELPTELPLRMLVVAPEKSGLDSRTEIANLLKAIEGMEKQVITRVLDKNVTYAAIRGELRDEKFHVLHFIGHGEFLNELPLLVLDDGRGGSESVDHERIGGLFTNHRTMKLVLLNSCKGAQVSSTESLLGMASQLVQSGVPAVIAMQYEIGDDQAILFAQEFYSALFKGDDKGRVEMAVSHARNSLLHDFPDDRVIGTPVLFSRAINGLLFNIRTGDLLQDLPVTKSRIHTLEAVKRTQEENLRILASAPERTEEVASAIQREEAQLTSVKWRLAFGIGLYVFAAVLVFALSRLAVLEALPRGLKMQTYTVWLVDRFFPKTFSDRIVLVPMTDQSAKRFGRPILGANWRGEHAKLVEKLSQAGARVVVFDLFFPKPKEFDEDFSRAILAARQRGTSVIVGIDQAPDRKPAIAPALAGAVTGWGLLCVGETQDSAEVVPLLVAKKVQPTWEPLPSLSLAAMAAYRGWTIVGLDKDTTSILVKAGANPPQRVGISGLETLARDQQFCGVLGAGDVAANRIIDFTPDRKLRDPRRRLPYEAILDSPSLRTADLNGKIVVVGAEVPKEKFDVWRGFRRHERYGYEIHADALNTLLQPVTIRPLAARWEFLAILILCLAGAAVWAWQPTRPLARWSVLLALVLVYLAVATWVYGSSRILMNTLYPVFGLLLCYGVSRRMRSWPWRSAVPRFNSALVTGTER